MSNTKEHINHHVKHAGFDVVAGILIGIFYKPKTAAGFAVKGAITGLIVYHLMHDSNVETASTTPQATHE